MFEQATLDCGPLSKRVWTTCMGLTGEALLLACAVVAPMVWPHALPRPGALITPLSAPGPSPGPVKPAAGPARARVAEPRPFQVRDGALVLPRFVPDRAAIIDEPPLEGAPSLGVAGGIGGGNGGPGGLLADILREGAPAVPPPLRADSAPPAKPAAGAVPRYRVGGLVRLGPPVSQPQPKYPQMAILARVSGQVKLEAVIGVEGRVRELKVLAGHPLLAPAAVEAVRHWIYRPTTLNGVPVEVIAPIRVAFKLN